MERPGKVYLSRYAALLHEISAIERAMEGYRERAEHITSRISAEPRATSKVSDQMAEAVADMADAGARLHAIARDAECMLSEILKVIRSVSDERAAAVLIDRYINLRSVREIADSMHYSDSTIFRLHDAGLTDVEAILSGEKYDMP